MQRTYATSGVSSDIDAGKVMVMLVVVVVVMLMARWVREVTGLANLYKERTGRS